MAAYTDEYSTEYDVGADGELTHDVEDIVARVLRDKGLAADPAPWEQFVFGKGTRPVTTWPVFSGAEPSEPDNAITVYETTPQIDAKLMPTGEVMKHHGVTIRVRGTSKTVAGNKARAVEVTLGQLVYDHEVTLDGRTYTVQSVPRVSLVPFGKGTSPRGIGTWLINLNCLVVIVPGPNLGA